MEKLLKERWLNENGMPKCFGHGLEFRRGHVGCEVLLDVAVCNEETKEKCHEESRRRWDAEKSSRLFIKGNLLKCADSLSEQVESLNISSPLYWEESDKIARKCQEALEQERINIDDYKHHYEGQ